MKLVTFTHAGRTRIGVVVEDEIVDLSEAAPDLPHDMLSFLEAGEPALGTARRVAGEGTRRIPLEDVKLEAPVPRPPKFLAIGLNYADHVAEVAQRGMKKPEHPTFFTKQVTCVTGPHDPIHVPRASKVVDYEGELALVIGQRCRHVTKQRAHEVITGYTVVNDVSVRDWQFQSPTMTLGKSFDTHGPSGPWIVTADEVGDPHGLRLRTWVNGDLRQDSSTKNLIFGFFEMVEHLSTVFTLEPGDIVSSGTPAGVGIAMKPPRLLVAGDVVRIEVEGIGVLENPVIDEPETTTLPR